MPEGLSVVGADPVESGIDPVPGGAAPDGVEDLLYVPLLGPPLFVKVSVEVEELGAGPPDASVLVAPSVPFGPLEPAAFVKPLVPPEFTVLAIGVSDAEGPPEPSRLETTTVPEELTMTVTSLGEDDGPPEAAVLVALPMPDPPPEPPNPVLPTDS